MHLYRCPSRGGPCRALQLQSVALARHCLLPLVRGTRLDRPADPTRRTADPGQGRERGRPHPVHRRGHPLRPARLALCRRPATGHRLGPRQLRRTGLVGRLAASRDPHAARGTCERRASGRLRRPVDAAARCRRCDGEGGDAAEPVRRDQRHDHRDATACPGDRAGRRTLRRAVRRRLETRPPPHGTGTRSPHSSSGQRGRPVPTVPMARASPTPATGPTNR